MCRVLEMMTPLKGCDSWTTGVEGGALDSKRPRLR